MTEILLRVPDKVADDARQLGLLTDEALQAMLEEAVRKKAWRELKKVMAEFEADPPPPMTMDEIVAEVKAVRAEMHASRATR